ncbi:MAG: hypothetical protein KatS3mg110_2056 [Pirellulaceae bacterium]|nr:MAG: hypothetical protein KatS3mg110_2056 [Pirellulaceae bacterium]
MSSPMSTVMIAKQARTIRLLACLQSGTAFNAKELSQRFNVSRRTIYRDLRLIRRAGVPIAFDSSHCGYRIDGGQDYVPAALGLTDEDLAKLALTSHLSILCAMPQFRISVRESLARLMLNFPRRVRETVATLINCCEVDSLVPQYPPSVLDRVEQLLEAMVRRHLVRLDMSWKVAPPSHPRRIQIAAYRLIADRRDWWLLGRSWQHERLVRLKVSDVESVTLLSQTYRMPSNLRSRSFHDDPRILDLA